jgi:hypothetical protein
MPLSGFTHMAMSKRHERVTIEAGAGDVLW